MTDYQKKLDNLKTQFSLATDEYVASYPQAQQYPNLTQYQTPYRNAEQAIRDANADLFALEGEVRTKVRELARELEMTDSKIDQMKSSNTKLSREASNIKGADKGAEGRSANAREKSYLKLYTSAALAAVGYFTFKLIRHT